MRFYLRKKNMSREDLKDGEKVRVWITKSHLAISTNMHMCLKKPCSPPFKCFNAARCSSLDTPSTGLHAYANANANLTTPKKEAAAETFDCCKPRPFGPLTARA